MMEKFNQMKELYALKKQTDEMKKRMEKIMVTVEEGPFEIVIRGDQNIETVLENGEERNDIKKAINKALKESQKEVSKKMRNQLGDMGFPGM